MFGPTFMPSRKASRAERQCYERVPKNLATNNGAVAPARAPAPEGSSKQRRCGAGCLAVAGLQGDPSAAHIMRKGNFSCLSLRVSTRPRRAGRLQRDRKSVVSGKSGSVRVDLGGGRLIKKKQNTQSDTPHIQ